MLDEKGKNTIVLLCPGPQKIQFGSIAHLPLALLSLASWMREYAEFSYDIKIIDMQLHPVSEDDFRNAMVVGISAMTGHQIKYGLDVASLVRSVNREALIVWGGIHASLVPEQTIMDHRVDLVIVGEGEQTFLEVVDAVSRGESLEGIPGTCLQRSDGEIIFGKKKDFLDLDELFLPAYDLVDMRDYKGIEKQFDYQSSRGCPFQCGFCYNTVFCGSRYRKKSAEKVVEELIYLHDTYGVINFGFVDDEFFIEKKRVEAIMDGILASGREFGIIASCRLDIANKFSDSLLGKMKKSGIKQIFFGAESGSSKILEDIQKGITREQIISGARKVAEAGIRPILSFMSGFPGEDRKDLEKTFDLIYELWKVHPLITINGVFPFNAYPGTMLHGKALELGFVAPTSLEDWGDWTFQYEPDNPWLDSRRKKWMQIAFYMVRYKYYVARYEDRYKGKFRIKVMKALCLPLSWLVDIRLRKRWFSFAWEWQLFAMLVRKTFGYL